MCEPQCVGPARSLLFNHKHVIYDEPLEPPNTKKYGIDAAWEAPELEKMTYLEQFDKIAEVGSLARERRPRCFAQAPLPTRWKLIGKML